MNSRSIMICLTATGISSLLLFFYFKNKLSTVEEKLDSMFQLIQNYAAQSEKRSNEAQWRVQESAPSQPMVNAIEEVENVNNSKIVVSDNDSSEDDSETDSEEEEEEEEIVKNDEEQNGTSVFYEVGKEGTEEEKSEEEKSEEETGDSLDGSEEGDSADDDEEEEEEEEEEQETQETTLENPTIELKMDDEVKNISVVDTIDYERMRVADLKNLARDRGLSGYRNLRKNDLIQLLSQ